jgi:Flp pilus assembly protein TadD
LALIEKGEFAKLSLEQLLYGATLVEDNATKAKIYAAATKFEDARAFNNLGVVCAEMGDWAAAATAFAKASSISADAAINNNLAVGALAQGKVAEAKQYVAGASAEAKALAAVAEGNYAAATGKLTGYNAAVNYVLEGNLSAAKSAIAGDKSAEAEYLRGVIAAQMGNASEAAAYVKSAISLNPALEAKAKKDVNLKGIEF